MFFIGKKLKQARQLIRQGELNHACQVTRQVDFAGSSMGRRIANQLIDRLVDRAGRSSFSGDLPAAWQDLIDASTIATDKNVDRVSKETNKLVDRTVDYAQTLLMAGKPASANSTIRLLSARSILDRRASELEKICGMISQAEQLAASGKLKDASSLLYETKQLRPDLTFLDARIRNFGYQQSQLAELTSELRFAINQSAWGGAKEVTNRILQIAPKHQVALDARRRCDTKQASHEKSIHWIHDRSPGEGDTSAPGPGQSTTSGKSVKMETGVNQQVSGNMPGEKNSSDLMRSFMLWIDGVGGFLVCTHPTVTIGRAVPNAGVDIPLQADLRRRHLKIKRVENQYLASSPGGPEVEAEDGSEWMLLNDQQSVDLGSGVRARFLQTHPLGRSARLEFTSRHRTEPWSDAVLLMGDAILMGPDRSNHVYCPRWKDQLVIYRQGDQIFLRSQNNRNLLEVDGQTRQGDILLKDGLQISGAEFSISCEEVSST